MPFMQNAKKQIALVYDNEVAALKKVGFKLLDAAEEEAHRLELKEKPELTSAAAQDAARVEAGVQTALTKASAAVESK